uniref:NADH-ubiquinone oxidoreductase chain 5 n=1 Tax=Paratemnoides elongatus TaxID=51805 RepID=H9MFH6_9ARAC|nr:NADH dehydrogenase subunit 5 [Paratemnoides elongatus]AEX37721.1 NADH dehydrogenase subunit 5 [Paratemnoides elongatus]
MVIGFYMFMWFMLLFMVGVMMMMKGSEGFVNKILSVNSSLDIEYEILLDWMSVLFMSVVLMISSMIMLYSYWYMGEGYMSDRFNKILLMFILSMCFLIINPHFLSMILGWDGLGFTSFLLVAFYCNYKSYHSSMITVLFNRIGDLALILFIISLFKYGLFKMNMLEMLEGLEMVWLVLMVAFSKSAQIPFSAWLPAAMAAPTPVSSLVHSSTLVTAGLYVLIRVNSYLEECGLQKWLMMVAMFTLVFASVSAIYEMDFKKIIAMSTLSQLGFMMFILSLGLAELSYMHMLIHAVFKATMFMTAGVLISFKVTQDIRKYGLGLFYYPLVGAIFNISNYSLMGFPFLGGFFSKEMFCVLYVENMSNLVNFIVFYISLLLTVIYSIRLSVYVYVEMSVCKNLELSTKMGMEYPLMVMGLMVCIFGGTMNEIMMTLFFYNGLTHWENNFLLMTVVFGVFMYLILKESFSAYGSYFSSMGLLYFLSGNSLIRNLIISSNFMKLEVGSLEMYGGYGLYSFLWWVGGFNLKLLANYSIIMVSMLL